MMHRTGKTTFSVFNRRGKKWRFGAFYTVFFIVAVILLIKVDMAGGEGWPDIKVRLLSDACFAVVDTDVGAKTRYCPHHDQNGRLDQEQLIYVLGTLDQETWLNPKHKKAARKHLEKHYDRFRVSIQKRDLLDPVNINKALLTELVTLPQIGPVLAVKIVEYRNIHNLYMTIEDIKKVDGIGPGTFRAIRHYISTR